MRPHRLAAVALALISTATAAATEPAKPTAPPSSTVSGVTVTAPDKQSPLVDPTTQFVRQHLPEGRTGQFPRFRDDICVKVQGLPPEFDAFVARRIVEIATEVGAPLAPAATCTPNVNVIFSPRPQAQLTDIAKRRDILFGFYFQAQLRKLSTFSRPIQSWYLARDVGTDGVNQLERVITGAFSNSQSGPVDHGYTLRGRAGSRLGEDMSTELVHSLIIADSNKVSGQPIGAVADYIAVLALARWQGLERCNGAPPTILNLMADGCDADERPEAATPADLALLRSLYAVDPRESGDMQRAQIADAARKAAKDGVTAH